MSETKTLKRITNIDGTSSDVYIVSGWDAILNKPTTFTPSAHTHTASQITAGVFDIARIPNITVSKITDIATNYSAISHKYHAFSNGQYFYDSISNDNFFQLFTNNFECDSIRFQTIYSVEYYNHSTSAWKTWTGGEANIKLLLDGNSSTGFSLDHTHRTFRFVTSRRSWPLNSLVVLQDTWTGLTRTNSGVKIEVATSSSPASWTSKLDITFGGSGWGTYSYYTNALHSRDEYVRITIDFTDWTDSDSYTTFPLRRFMLLHNYNPLAGYMTPITWDYDRKITVQSLNSVGAISEGGTALASKYLQIANLTASAIITALGTTAVNRATADASGNTITSTYLTQASAASTYAPISHTHTSSQITDLLNTAHTFTAKQTISLAGQGLDVTNSTWASGTETPVAKFMVKTGSAQYGSISIIKEGPNSGIGLRFDQVDGTTRLLFRGSATAGAMVWNQPESASALYLDVDTVKFSKSRNSYVTSSGFYENNVALASKYLALAGGTMTGKLLSTYNPVSTDAALELDYTSNTSSGAHGIILKPSSTVSGFGGGHGLGVFNASAVDGANVVFFDGGKAASTNLSSHMDFCYRPSALSWFNFGFYGNDYLMKLDTNGHFHIKGNIYEGDTTGNGLGGTALASKYLGISAEAASANILNIQSFSPQGTTGKLSVTVDGNNVISFYNGYTSVYPRTKPVLVATLTASTSTYSVTSSYMYYVEVDYTESSITYTATLTLRGNQMSGKHAFLFKRDSSHDHNIAEVDLTSGACSAGSSTPFMALIDGDVNAGYTATLGNIRIYQI